MKKIELFKKIDEVYEENKTAVVGTITSIAVNENKPKHEGENNKNGNQKLVGEKFLLVADDKTFYTDDRIVKIIEKLKNNFKNIVETKDTQTMTIDLNDLGKYEVFINPVINNPRLIIFGGGHVACPLAKIGKMADFDITVVDYRESLLTRERYPTADNLICREFEDYLAGMNVRNNDYIVIVTSGHKYDYDVLEKVIDSQARYIGMIGSSRKVKLIFERLKDEKDVSDKLINKVHAPIGIEIGSETPAEIAVSIMGEIISVRRGQDE